MCISRILLLLQQLSLAVKLREMLSVLLSQISPYSLNNLLSDQLTCWKKINWLQFWYLIKSLSQKWTGTRRHVVPLFLMMYIFLHLFDHLIALWHVIQWTMINWLIQEIMLVLLCEWFPEDWITLQYFLSDSLLKSLFTPNKGNVNKKLSF